MVEHRTRLIAQGGEIETVEPSSCPKGYQNQSGRPFFNTPARLKYMKSQQQNYSHIVDMINRLSLAHPEVALSCSMMVKS